MDEIFYYQKQWTYHQGRQHHSLRVLENPFPNFEHLIKLHIRTTSQKTQHGNFRANEENLTVPLKL